MQLLLAYLNNHRPETPHIDMHLAESDARSLYQAGEARLGTDEETIIHILSTRSAAQLTASFHKYRQMYGRDIEKVCVILSSSPIIGLESFIELEC